MKYRIVKFSEEEVGVFVFHLFSDQLMDSFCFIYYLGETWGHNLLWSVILPVFSRITPGGDLGTIYAYALNPGWLHEREVSALPLGKFLGMSKVTSSGIQEQSLERRLHVRPSNNNKARWLYPV